jgi:hypothetical protein
VSTSFLKKLRACRENASNCLKSKRIFFTQTAAQLTLRTIDPDRFAPPIVGSRHLGRDFRSNPPALHKSAFERTYRGRMRVKR